MICAIVANEDTGTCWPANCVAGQHGKNGGGEKRGDLRLRKRRNKHAVGGGRGDVDDDAKKESEEAASKRYLKDKQRHQKHQREIRGGEADIRNLGSSRNRVGEFRV